MTNERNQQLRAASLFFDLTDHLRFFMMSRSILRYGDPRAGKPGEAFQKLPTEQQELLKHLKSDDVAKMRHDLVV